MQAKDLTKEYPRSPLEEVGGFVWLGRLIDKVRAKHAGTLGEYTAYPCGSDKRFLSTFGIETDALEKFIVSGASDQEISDWCRQHAQHQPEEGTASLRSALLAPVPAEIRDRFEQVKADLAAHRPDLDLAGADSFTWLILLEEGHPIPAGVK